MDKVKDMMPGHHHKEGEHTTPTTTGGYGNEAGTAEHEKKGMFGLGGHKKEGEKKHGFMGMGGGDSSSSSDEEREGAAERNRLRRERRAQRQQAEAQGGMGPTGVTTAVPQ